MLEFSIATIFLATSVGLTTAWGLDYSTTKDGCSKALLTLVTPKGEITCEEMKAYTICEALARGLLQRPATEEDIYEVSKALEDHLLLLVLECDIDVRAVINQLHSSFPPSTYETAPPTEPHPEPLDCVHNAVDCLALPNGDYPACFPLCQNGIYISCSNGLYFERECASDRYWEATNKNSLYKMVYDPALRRCERSTPYCPRDFDQYTTAR